MQRIYFRNGGVLLDLRGGKGLVHRYWHEFMLGGGGGGGGGGREDRSGDWAALGRVICLFACSGPMVWFFKPSDMRG